MMLLAYWDLRGLVEPIRLMLEYCGVEYEMKVFKQADGREPWLQVKNTIGMDYPNLPYLVDGDVKMSESLAMMKYIARKGKLTPSSEEEQINLDVAEGAVVDFHMAFTPMCYNSDFENLKGPFLEKLPERLSNFNQVLGKRSWLAGENLTYIDFRFAEVLDHVELCYPGCLDHITNIKNYKNKFEALEKIAAYKKSDRFNKWPLNGAIASWGGKNEEDPNCGDGSASAKSCCSCAD